MFKIKLAPFKPTWLLSLQVSINLIMIVSNYPQIWSMTSSGPSFKFNKSNYLYSPWLKLNFFCHIFTGFQFTQLFHYMTCYFLHLIHKDILNDIVRSFLKSRNTLPILFPSQRCLEPHQKRKWGWLGMIFL